VKHKKKRTSPVIYPAMSPNELDTLLWTEYRNGLYSFTFCLAEVVFDMPIIGEDIIWKLRSVRYPGYVDFIAEIRRLEDIRTRAKKLVKPLKFHFRKYPDSHKYRIELSERTPTEYFVPQKTFRDTQDEERRVVQAYRLDGFFENIEKEIKHLEFHLMSMYQKRPGKPVQAIIILHALWSLVMRKDKNADMKNVSALVSWFANRLKRTDYGYRLNYQFTDPSVYRFMKKNELLLTEAKEFYFPVELEEHVRPDNFQFDFSQPRLEVKSIHIKCKRNSFPQIIFPNQIVFIQEFTKNPQNDHAIPVWTPPPRRRSR
jgi:hypothetical protein